MNKLVLVGNGFDLAHGLPTTYMDFLNWYVCQCYECYYKTGHYNDPLFQMQNTFASSTIIENVMPVNFDEVLARFNRNSHRMIQFHSFFFKKLLSNFGSKNWVDIERYYFSSLKSKFTNNSVGNKKEEVTKLNNEFDQLILKLIEYIETINKALPRVKKLKSKSELVNFPKVFIPYGEIGSQVKILNFNYTHTLQAKAYAHDENIIHIHGSVKEIDKNPIIFGYGDETDPVYQDLEDSGENMYLEHIKSFGYFMTNNYNQMLSYIDSDLYTVYIVGHSCGLSDRVLLNTIFEHPNCKRIEIFYHQRSDGTDNFKEITQQISRHFRPKNKDIMRRKVTNKNSDNIIPQNSQ